MNKLIYFAMAATCGLAFVSCSGDDDYESATPMGADMNYSANYAPMRETAMEGNVPDEQLSGDQFTDFTDNPFVKCDEESTSTFSVDADGASYAIMRKYVNKGFEISPAQVRIEEFLNYFTYDYAEPTDNHTVAINTEIADCPWNPEHKLLRLGIKGKSLPKDQIPKSNYVFLVDVSGSMWDSDKLPLLKSGLKTLVAHLDPEDRISLITYAGRVSKELESTPAKEIDKINSAIGRLTSEGSTNGGQALIDAYKEALANYIEGGNNRVILGTDGDFNVGITSTDELLKIVEEYADKGIFTTVCGFGVGNLNDGMMEGVSNRGNGTYEYIDCEKQMMKVFAHEKSRLISVACDSKCQVKFNPAVVESYRLIGYENRVMNNEDFHNDAKDAGEIGSGQTITALYEINLAEETAENANETKIATFDFRYKKHLGEQSYLLSLDVQKSDIMAEPSGEFCFAAGVAAYGMILRKSPYKGNSTITLAKKLADKGLTFDELQLRHEFVSILNNH